MRNLYLLVIEYLKSSSDEKYKLFNEKIVNSTREVLGVTTPKMREIAKKIAANNCQEYLDQCKFNYFEDTMIFGFVIASLPYDIFLNYLPVYLENVDSWAHIDSFVCSIKSVETNYFDFYKMINDNVKNSQGFSMRFYIVMLMNYYLKEEYLDSILKICEDCDGNGYYNDMAISWLISVAYVKFRDKTLEFIKNCKLSSFTLNKSISKIKDSFRVSHEDKVLLQNYRRKK